MIGLLGRKKGMTTFFDAAGKALPVTILELGPCPVVQVKTTESDGYNAVQLGFEPVDRRRVNSPDLGHFKRAGVKPLRHLREFRDYETSPQTGEVLKADLFKSGDKVNVIGVSKGRGFAGVIKRHGFHRPNQSHGTHEIFRGAGSIGAGSFPGRVFPGLKMPGRMGGNQVTTKNLRVVFVDAEKSLVAVKGAVPGAPGGIIAVVKRTAR